MAASEERDHSLEHIDRLPAYGFEHPEEPRTAAELSAQLAANVEFLREALEIAESNGDDAGAARIRDVLERIADGH